MIVKTPESVTLVGGGAVTADMFQRAIGRAPVLVAADSGADFCIKNSYMPEAVIGDFDSIADETRAAIPQNRLHPIGEQDSTDFEKCLSQIVAKMVLGVGFLGKRLDHQLAAMSSLVRHAHQKVILLGEEDVVCLAPPRIALDLPVGSRLSLYPLGPVQGFSDGLEWPIEGLSFDPLSQIGTSNRVTGPVELTFDAPAMLLILPADVLDPLMTALDAAPGFPARADRDRPQL